MARERTSHHNGFNLMQSTRAASVRVLLLLGIVISILCSPHGLLHLYDDISHAVIISILCSHSDYVIVPVSNISLAFSSCFVFLFVPIISHFIFTINLVSRLFTLYTSLRDGKRAPTIVGRGSSPRSRTGCDIFNFWQLRGLLRGIGQELPSRLCFNLMQSRGLRLENPAQ